MTIPTKETTPILRELRRLLRHRKKLESSHTLRQKAEEGSGGVDSEPEPKGRLGTLKLVAAILASLLALAKLVEELLR